MRFIGLGRIRDLLFAGALLAGIVTAVVATAHQFGTSADVLYHAQLLR